MARKVGKLTALEVTRLKVPGLYGDGGNLWLQVGKAGNKSWVFRYTLNGKPRSMGLGAVSTVGLAQARAAATDQRLLLLAGKDPLAERRAREAATQIAAASNVNFEAAAIQYIEAHQSAWSPRYVEDWKRTLGDYAYPVAAKLPVASIDTTIVLNAVQPIWSMYPTTAKRVRERIESILDWAKSRGYRAGENPARWRGHMENLLAAAPRSRTVTHFAALPYAEVGDLMAKQRGTRNIEALALQFTILTVSRSSEVLQARWQEIDLDSALWTVPAERMKARRPHRVPISTQALALLRSLQSDHAPDAYVFPGYHRGKPLCRHITKIWLRRHGYTEPTIHGFRSSFRDWTADCTNFAREVAEFALAHKVGDRTELSYFRSDLFAKRIKLMQAWADYCDMPSAAHGHNVVPIGATG